LLGFLFDSEHKGGMFFRNSVVSTRFHMPEEGNLSSLPCSKKPATGPYPKTIHLRFLTLLLKIRLMSSFHPPLGLSSDLFPSVFTTEYSSLTSHKINNFLYVQGLKSTPCDITPCSPFKVDRCFGGTYRLHLQGRLS
jgi:hypothetical protein